MQEFASRYTFRLILSGMVVVVLSSYLAIGVQTLSNSSVAGEVSRGLFLLLSFSALLYYFIGYASKKINHIKYQYQSLFEENPNPMWVYEVETLKILAVNNAALQTYGYSREEFLSLTLLELRPTTEVNKLLDNLREIAPSYSSSGAWLHQKKSGETFFVNIFSHQTLFNNKNARLVLSLNINEQLMAEQRILEQNKKLMEIAHLQSHNVRRPVASIMGLVNLFDRRNPANELNGVVIEKLDVVCKELDTTIHQIVEKTHELEIEQQQ